MSTDPGRRYTLRDCAEAAVQVLDALGVSEPVDWVGNAWGGHVGLLVAADWPERCRSVAAFGTPIAALTPAEKRRTLLLIGLYRLLGPSPTIVTERPRCCCLHAPSSVIRMPWHSSTSLRRADRRMLLNAIVSISIRRPDLEGFFPESVSPCHRHRCRSPRILARAGAGCRRTPFAAGNLRFSPTLRISFARRRRRHALIWWCLCGPGWTSRPGSEGPRRAVDGRRCTPFQQNSPGGRLRVGGLFSVVADRPARSVRIANPE